jgi:hypothetical protein
MTTITAEELVTLRRKINDKGQQAFSDPELDEIWVEAGESMSKAIFLCLEEITIDAARFNDYTQNETTEKRSQVFDHLMSKLLPYWKAKAEEETNSTATVSRIVGTRVVPRRAVERPYTDPGSDLAEWWKL